jgi:hypothetical protein
VRCKWGTGTTSERAPDTVAAKEVKSNFEKMMAERAKQDAAWFAEAAESSLSIPETQSKSKNPNIDKK